MQKPSDRTSYAAGFPAKTSATPASERVWLGSAPAFGGSMQGSFASFDLGSSSWKTSQLCLDGDLATYSETWPRAGTMRSGTAFRRQPSAPLTAVIGSSWSRGEYPTPSATAYGTSQNEGKVAHKRPTAGTPSLDTWARTWPTPTAKLGDARRGFPTTETGASRLAGGRRNLDDAAATTGRPLLTTCTHGGECKPTLNPRFVEWLQGFPSGHTDLEPSETP